MKFCTALMLLTSAGYLATVLCFPVVNKSGGANGLNDVYVNATTINFLTQDLIKRQNAQTLAVIMFAITGLVEKLNGENLGRSQYTQEFITTLHTAWPTYNYVICDEDNDFSFQGTQGIDWDQVVIEDQNQIYYDVVVGAAGEFTRHGNGDWAYIGNIVSTNDDGWNAIIVFKAP